jgi:hypothetical protein
MSVRETARAGRSRRIGEPAGHCALCAHLKYGGAAPITFSACFKAVKPVNAGQFGHGKNGNHVGCWGIATSAA